MPGGGGGHSTFIWTGGGGGAAGGRKPDPVTNHSARQKCTLSQYTLLKLSYAYPVLVRTDSLFCCVKTYHHTFIKICCAPRAPSRLVPDRGDRGPIINIVVPHTPSRRWCRDCGPIINIREFSIAVNVALVNGVERMSARKSHACIPLYMHYNKAVQ